MANVFTRCLMYSLVWLTVVIPPSGAQGQSSLAQPETERAHTARIVVLKSFDAMHDKYGYTLHTILVPSKAIKNGSFDVPVTRITYQASAFFDYDSAELTKEAKAIVTDLAKALKADADLRHIAVVGHTDGIGADEYNIDLSLRRAETVATALTSLGINTNKIWIAGMGKSQPVASNATPGSRALNRRVEFFLSDHREAIVPSIQGRCNFSNPDGKKAPHIACDPAPGTKVPIHSFTPEGAKGAKVEEVPPKGEHQVQEVLVRQQHIPVEPRIVPHIR